MNMDRRRVLDMLEEGKIDAAEAEKLLLAMHMPGMEEPVVPIGGDGNGKASKYQYLRILVEKDGSTAEGERVNLKIPLRLIRSGVRVGALLPSRWRERIRVALEKKGITYDLNSKEAWDLLMDKLMDFSVDVESPGERVRVYFE